MIPKKVLIIKAHPSSQGFVHSIAHSIQAGSTSIGNNNYVIDLYKDHFDNDKTLPYLNFEEKKDMSEHLPARAYYQDKITNSDHIIFLFPLWWMFMPAILKNFIDQVFSAKFAFTYENGQRKGLLTGKTGHFIITCDGPKIIYYLLGLPFCTIIMLGLFKFCGMNIGKMMIFDQKFKRSDEEKQEFLDKIIKFGSKLK